MNGIQAVALGAGTADLVVRNGRVLIAHLGEFRERDVAVVGDRIAALPADASGVVGDDTTVIDADGRAVVPGFVDAHTHADFFQTIETAYHRLLEGGTTAVVTETSALGGAFGADGVRELLAAAEDLPLAVRATVPAQPFFDTFDEPADEATREAVLDLLGDDRVVGVGESDWIHVVGRDSPAEEVYERARSLGKRVVGHGAGCSDEKLTAYAGVVDNDHEAIAADEILDRVERGIHPVGRTGSVRDDSDAFAEALRERDFDASLSTDGVWPDALVEGEAMDGAVRRVIDAGVDPATALRTATLGPARHFGLDDRGAVAPGNAADLVILGDVETVAVDAVVAGGEVVVSDGEATVGPREHGYPAEYRDSVSVDAPPERFRVPAGAARDGAVRALEYRHGLITTETAVEPAVDGDALAAAPDDDVAKAALLDRRPGVDDGFVGFLTGLGIEEGAAATTLTWEASAVAAVGVDDEAMAAAVDRVAEMGGGWAVVSGGEATPESRNAAGAATGDVVAELPTPIAGFATDAPVAETATRLDDVRDALRSIGVGVERPLLAVQTLSFVGVPSLKLTARGYADIFDRSVVGLTPDAE
ncbi:adenine deaminase [Halostella sp. JP-L12]|uniref:adenine deaminase C-terminal domain-containing protein n=1 Tax=Halostella TaxID=1843185 RepID=UPI000EF824CC|nr:MULTISPECIES: adenine deaminase C-terminal domain-containing protein [Halostella]NHN48393.1 adenine deaminase [Halostella sp. JP-L12]